MLLAQLVYDLNHRSQIPIGNPDLRNSLLWSRSIPNDFQYPIQDSIGCNIL